MIYTVKMNPAVDNARKPSSFVAMLEAGVVAIAESGVDRISVSQVAKITGHTRPTFYSYFGDTNGLLAEIWLAWGEAWLDRLADFKYKVDADSPENQRLNLALTEIMAISHRCTEVLEVVEPALTKWWRKFDGETDLGKLKVIWLMGERLGTGITAQVDRQASLASFIEPALAAVPNEPFEPLAPISAAKMPEVSSPVVAADSTESQLIQAAADVIAASGVAATSMARIARKGQVSTGTIYPRFDTITDLVDASFELSVNGVLEQNFAQMEGTSFSPEDFGLFVMAGLGKPRKTWRNFRIEIHLEGRLREGLRDRITKNLRETNARVAEKLGAYDLPDLVVAPIPYLIHTVGIGFAILQNAGLELLAYDHRLVTKEMVRVILQNAKK